METVHLTTVEHLGPNTWEARCDCGWRQTALTRKDARAEAWNHWAQYPAVTSI